jgi:predicted transcriptional regulator YheO
MKSDIYQREYKLGKTDKITLRSFEPVVEGIARVFGSNCEVVLHSLENTSKSVIKIVNGHVTGRKVGSPLTDVALEILNKAETSENNYSGPYYTKLDDGRLLRSVTTLIRNYQNQPIGLICINFDLSVSLLDFITELLPKDAESSERVNEYFPSTLQDLIHRTLDEVLVGVSNQRAMSPSEKNKLMVVNLYKRSIFNIKGAVDLVAREMGVSRYTVYNYIREAKIEVEANPDVKKEKGT